MDLNIHLPNVSQLVYGCMGLGASDKASLQQTDINKAKAAIDAALEIGINFFDHADIYSAGTAEQVFGEILKIEPSLRDNLFIQSKGSIRRAEGSSPQQYDSSKQWITHCVEQSLSRLHTDYLDIWLLHRPDPLIDVHEVAETFTTLKKQGKIKYFGVSNMHAQQTDFLQQHLSMPLIVNQIEMSLQQINWLEEGVLFNNNTNPAINFTNGTIEYCRSNKVQIQAWGSMAKGLFSGRDTSQQSSSIQNTATHVNKLAEKYSTTPETIVLAWLLRHPANVQPIIGTTDPTRIQACAQATDITLSRDEWYTLYLSSRGNPLP